MRRRRELEARVTISTTLTCAQVQAILSEAIARTLRDVAGVGPHCMVPRDSGIVVTRKVRVGRVA